MNILTRISSHAPGIKFFYPIRLEVTKKFGRQLFWPIVTLYNSKLHLGFFRPKLRINLACKFFTISLHSTARYFGEKQSKIYKYSVTAWYLGPLPVIFKLKKNYFCIVLHTNFVWRACQKRCADRSCHGKFWKLKCPTLQKKNKKGQQFPLARSFTKLNCFFD